MTASPGAWPLGKLESVGWVTLCSQWELLSSLGPDVLSREKQGLPKCAVGRSCCLLPALLEDAPTPCRQPDLHSDPPPLPVTEFKEALAFLGLRGLAPLLLLGHRGAGGAGEAGGEAQHGLSPLLSAVSRFVKYTGYGNAAGLLAARGLMAGGREEGEYSEDEDTDTEEYKEAKPK